MRAADRISRYSAQERANHWVVALLFVLAGASGLALFHPAFFFLSNFFGGGTWDRILHPFLGVLMFLSFLGLMVRFWSHNHYTPADREWLRRFRDVLNNREEGLDTGKYNAGQKTLFWVMVTTTILLLISGIIIWQPWFAPYFPIGLLRVAVVVHSLSAWVLIAGIFVHVYAAIWVKGTVRAMTRGDVSRAWAKKHHPAWYREISK